MNNRSWYKHDAIIASIIGGIFLLIVTIIAYFIAPLYWDDNSPIEVMEFNENDIGVLILPFDPLEDCSSRNEYMAKAIYKNLKRTIDNNDLPQFKVQYISEGLCANNHFESREIGNKYKADIVVWGELWEKCPPGTSFVSIYYSLTNPNSYYEIKSAGTGIRSTTSDRILEGELLNDLNYIISFLVALYFFEKSDLDNAAHYFKESLNYTQQKINNAVADVNFCLGNINRFQSNYPEAISYFKRALEINPDLNRARANLGLTLLSIGEQNEATKYLEICTKLVPNSANDFNTRGVAYFALGEYQDALSDFSKALEMEPIFALAYVNKGISYVHLHQYHNAIKELDKALSLNSEYGLAFSPRAYAFVQLKQYSRALEEINKALELNPLCYENNLNKSGILTYLGRYQEAIKSAQKAAELNPVLPYAFYNQAVNYGYLKMEDDLLHQLEFSFEKGLLKVYPVDSIKFEPAFKNINHDSRFINMLDKYNK